MSRRSGYSIEEIIKDYEGGYSLPKLHEKYEISTKYAWKIVRKAGKTRDKSESRLFRSKGWRKLTRLGSRGKKYSTRIVSIPFKLLKELGFKEDDDLVAKWKISDDHLELFIKKRC